jgi:hypothetical protein
VTRRYDSVTHRRYRPSHDRLGGADRCGSNGASSAFDNTHPVARRKRGAAEHRCYRLRAMKAVEYRTAATLPADIHAESLDLDRWGLPPRLFDGPLR